MGSWGGDSRSGNPPPKDNVVHRSPIDNGGGRGAWPWRARDGCRCRTSPLLCRACWLGVWVTVPGGLILVALVARLAAATADRQGLLRLAGFVAVVLAPSPAREPSRTLTIPCCTVGVKAALGRGASGLWQTNQDERRCDIVQIRNRLALLMSSYLDLHGKFWAFGNDGLQHPVPQTDGQEVLAGR